MSFEKIKEIVKGNHDTGAFMLARFTMPQSTRRALRVQFGTMIGSSFTEAAEMSAAKHGLSIHTGILPGFSGMDIIIDDTMEENTWKLVDPNGKILFEGTVNEGNE